jgi:hypothetical protein
MKTVVNWLQNLRFFKAFTVFLAVIFLFLVQACNRPGIAAQPPQPSAQPPNSQRYDPTKDYPLSPYQGGMNNFSDVDPRAENSEESARRSTDNLIKSSQSNLRRKSINSPEEYVRNYQQGTPLPERVKRLGEDVGSSAQELQEGVTKGTQRGVENLKDNLQKTVQ